MRKDWSRARLKVNKEFTCRSCGSGHWLEAAHTIGQARQDVIVEGPKGGRSKLVKEECIIPLCHTCHRAYDAHTLDVLPLLTLDEQLAAVEAAGGIYAALERLEPSEFGKGAA